MEAWEPEDGTSLQCRSSFVRFALWPGDRRRLVADEKIMRPECPRGGGVFVV